MSRLSATAIAFEDPPHVKGDGVPSGGPSPANGVLTYAPHQASYLETCTLPGTEHRTCTAILDDFLARYGKR